MNILSMCWRGHVVRRMRSVSSSRRDMRAARRAVRYDKKKRCHSTVVFLSRIPREATELNQTKSLVETL